MILGASFDSVADQKAFAESEGFPYRLLSDPDKVVGKAYHAEREEGEKRAAELAVAARGIETPRVAPASQENGSVRSMLAPSACSSIGSARNPLIGRSVGQTDEPVNPLDTEPIASALRRRRSGSMGCGRRSSDDGGHL